MSTSISTLALQVWPSLLIAVLMERKTKRQYFNHEKSEGDWDLFDDSDEE